MAYDVNKLAKLASLKALAEKINSDFAKKSDLTPIQSSVDASIKSGKVDGNTVYLYTSTDNTGSAAFTFDFPKEMFLDQTKTVFVPSFTWSSTTYSNSTNPNLNGKPVMVLAVKGSDNTCTYSFLDMESLVDTYENATTSKAGLMSSADKTKLDRIAADANKTVVDASLSSTSTNPVQNKVIKAALDAKADSSHPHTEYENQNAFSNVVVGSTTVTADTPTDTLTLVAGTNVTITANADSDTVTIAAKDTTYSAATTSKAGLMSSTDKAKLDGFVAATDTEVTEMLTEVFGA